jgi:hypothetical protein
MDSRAGRRSGPGSHSRTRHSPWHHTDSFHVSAGRARDLPVQVEPHVGERRVSQNQPDVRSRLAVLGLPETHAALARQAVDEDRDRLDHAAGARYIRGPAAKGDLAADLHGLALSGRIHRDLDRRATGGLAVRRRYRRHGKQHEAGQSGADHGDQGSESGSQGCQGMPPSVSVAWLPSAAQRRPTSDRSCVAPGYLAPVT